MNLGRSGVILGHFGIVLASFCGCFGTILNSFSGHFGALLTLLGGFRACLGQNPVILGVLGQKRIETLKPYFEEDTLRYRSVKKPGQNGYE